MAINTIASFSTLITTTSHASAITDMPPTTSVTCGGLETYNWSISNLADAKHNFTTEISIAPVNTGEARINFTITGIGSFTSDTGNLVVSDILISGRSLESGTIAFQLNTSCTPGMKNLNFTVYAGTFDYNI